MRAAVRRHPGHPLVTQAIESRHMVEAGRYREVGLPHRFAGAAMPDMRAIDLTQDPPPRGRWLAPELVRELEANLERGEIFAVPRCRGFAPLTLCRHCGHRFQCPNCTAWMVEHRLMHRLACHHCGHVMPPPKACPECGTEDSLVPCGPGVERIADEVAALFPDARTAIVTSDTIWSRQGRGVRRRHGRGRHRHRRRHPAHHQGLSLPQPRLWSAWSMPTSDLPAAISARGRTQFPADPAGRRARRAWRQAGTRAGPDSRPGRAGHRGVGVRRCRRLLRRGNRCRGAKPRCRRSGVWPRSSSQPKMRWKPKRSPAASDMCARSGRHGRLRPGPGAPRHAPRPPPPAPACPRPPQPRRPGPHPRLASR